MRRLFGCVRSLLTSSNRSSMPDVHFSPELRTLYHSRYKFLCRLCSGQMSTVWLAEDLQRYGDGLSLTSLADFIVVLGLPPRMLLSKYLPMKLPLFGAFTHLSCTSSRKYRPSVTIRHMRLKVLKSPRVALRPFSCRRRSWRTSLSGDPSFA